MNFLREGFLFIGLFLLILLVNYPILVFGMLYIEQPLIYLANQHIKQISDLVNVYLHPQLLDWAIPFFRPSGHFLIYQLITPVLGWHSIRALIVVNFIFLTGSCYLIIKLYSMLFPRFKTGGFIAASFYLMHPALSLSRLISLHFEFAYIFFSLLGLFCFIQFCQKNHFGDHRKNPVAHYPLLLGALLFYVIAVTFKEPALMLGPVYLIFFLFALYRPQKMAHFFYELSRNKEIIQILILLIATTVTITIYMTLPWPTLTHPAQHQVGMAKMLAAANELFTILFGLQFPITQSAALLKPKMWWRGIETLWMVRLLTWILLFFTLRSLYFLFKTNTDFIYKKSILFLCCAVLLFLILPVLWGMGLPWHLSPTLVFFGMLLGFGFEYAFRARIIGYAVALIIALFTFKVDAVNVLRYKVSPMAKKEDILQLIRNAVLYPPLDKNKINAETVLIVEDSTLNNAYALGNSRYPLANTFDYLSRQQWLFMRSDLFYNGTLFRYAYLMPELKEEVYPFQIAHMDRVPSEMIHHWLQHEETILCFGYDANANWHDRTAAFKKALAKEQQKRNLEVYPYHFFPAIELEGKVIEVKDLVSPDPHTCQYLCDQNVICRGFTFNSSDINNRLIRQCAFYSAIVSHELFCASCTGFIKGTS